MRRASALQNRVRAGAQLAMDGEQQLGRPTVGAMHGKSPAEMLTFGAQRRAVPGDQRLIVAAPELGAAGGDAAQSLRLDELHASGIRKAFLRRVYDLHDMAARAVRGELPDDPPI